MYYARRVRIGKTPQLDELAHECGRLYSQTLVSFWRTVRQKGIWLKPRHLMRWHTSRKLHAHTADATVQAFFAALKSWRERRKEDPDAKPPHKRKWYFRKEGGYTVTVPALLGCITQGETIEQCIERAREAIAGYIESLIADGEPVPEETERPQMITINVAA